MKQKINSPRVIAIIQLIILFTIECPNGYQDLIFDSNRCYRIVTDYVNWDEAKLKCEEDNAALACFSNQQERDILADECDQCWVGYTWIDGILYLESLLFS